jgi:hypothetical protein
MIRDWLQKAGMEGMADPVTGEDFLRRLAAKIIEQGDVRDWWSRFSSAYQALDVVEAVDEATAREIGEEIRAGLRARTGEEVRGFHLGSRHRGGETIRPHGHFDSTDHLDGFGVRVARAPLPASMADGGIDFVSWTDHGAWLVCSGAGPPPWPRPQHRRPLSGTGGGFVTARSTADQIPSPEDAMFAEVVDDRDVHYRLKMSSLSASNPGAPRERWDLRLHLTPTPDAAARWLRFTTPHGPVTAALQPATATDTVTQHEAMDPAEFYLHGQLHNHAWRHLLDPERRLARLTVVADALVVTGAVSRDHPVVAAVYSIDDAIAGEDAPALPTLVSTALQRRASQIAWIGCSALGVAISHPDGGQLGLESLVGHPDRLALHFVQPVWQQPQRNAWELVVTATDNRGRGHVSATEPLSSPSEGAFHFRPPLAADALGLTIRLQGATTVMETKVDLSNTGA